MLPSRLHTRVLALVPPTHPPGKPVTRRTILSLRDGLAPSLRAAASAAIAERAFELIVARRPSPAVIGLYAPKGSEVDTAALDERLRAAGYGVAYPRILDDRRELGFRTAAIDELAPARFGLREPGPGPLVALDAIDAFVVPGIAFDRAGGRIGWGRGHYDATLAAAPRALRIGLAFACQVIEGVPRDPHDIHLHYVVTEASTDEAP